MADKRIRELDALGVLTDSHQLGVDKSGLTEAKKITLVQLMQYLGVRAGTESLTQGVGATVTFPYPFNDTYYSLVVNGYDANGNDVVVKVTSRVASSFVATSAADCTLNYLAFATASP